MKTLHVTAAVLLVVGGLNWGLVALANFDLVAFITGAGEPATRPSCGVASYRPAYLSTATPPTPGSRE